MTTPIVATVSDPAGNVGSCYPDPDDRHRAPTVSIDGGPSRTTTDATPTITGSSPDVAVGSPVTVTIDGQTLTTEIAVDGTFAVTAGDDPERHPLRVRDRHRRRRQHRQHANQALTVNAIAPTVTYTNGPTASTNDATPLDRGTTNAPVGSLVVVTRAGQTLRASVQPGGSWNVTAATIGNGDVTVVTQDHRRLRQRRLVTQILTIDSTTPTTITITAAPSVATNDATPRRSRAPPTPPTVGSSP